jgi:hypothetical protein
LTLAPVPKPPVREVSTACSSGMHVTIRTAREQLPLPSRSCCV